jgi:hypothetical protein
MKLRKGFNLYFRVGGAGTKTAPLNRPAGSLIPVSKKEGLRMGEKIAYVPIHVRLLREQYEFLRKYSYDKRVSKAEVIREALEMYREVKKWAEE